MTVLELMTERLCLRPVADRDAGATAALMTPDVAANLTTWPPSMSVHMAQDRIRAARESLTNLRALELAIRERRSSALLGWISVGMPPRAQVDTPRIGFWLGTTHQGLGVMSEAAQAAIPAAAAILSLRSIEACVYPWNLAGTRLIRKLGFEPRGTIELFSPVRGLIEEARLFNLAVRQPLQAEAASETESP